MLLILVAGARFELASLAYETNKGTTPLTRRIIM